VKSGTLGAAEHRTALSKAMETTKRELRGLKLGRIDIVFMEWTNRVAKKKAGYIEMQTDLIKVFRGINVN
jgi:hypothetical protein